MGGSEEKGEKIWGKEVANGRNKNRKEERNGRPRNSLGSLPSGLVLACSCPFITFSFFRAFFFFFLSYCRFKHSFEQGMIAAMFFLERVYTYRLVCVQATFACSDRKRGEERKETDKRGDATEKRHEDNAIGANWFLTA